ncbi:hypothetical protein SAMN04489729_5345 [Amycolatopsis lurida]|uniref:DUF3800 domain-containing protein n=1 Tax=Amycolatopsis lurida NRRL 2430 TaxID=1460371 RepID=A0A2P2FQ38_AMYLU|nr:DUF3800 domain-containing protein [Amycolatopsis lurida]KFU78845.1 hypothetical protein BB31_22725 [Amycolatopsis lurida NRRL 2430]SED81233.1 hypothetical protein SAMN04489729_5345 [Amycolatopsis lurida]
MSALQAFADESFKEDDDGGFYVLAAAVLPVERHSELREVMFGIRAERTGKLHWNVLTDGQKRAVVKQVADFGELHLVAVGTPVPARRQERGRSLCMQRLVTELHALGVGLLVAEGRTVQLDARDVRTVQQCRFSLPRGAVFRIRHVRGADEPLLWISDIVAGAVRARRQGIPDYADQLAECAIEFQVDTRA